VGAKTTLLRNDVRNALRDQTIGALFFVPLIFLVLLRFGFPLLREHVPAAADHGDVALSLFCGIAATFPAFMMAFLMLDERDQNVTAVMRVLPVRWSSLIASRAVAVTAVGAINCTVLVFGSGLNPHPVPQALLLALLCALVAPTALLIAVSLASNKIEGLTLFKGLFFVLFLAAAAQAVDSGWRYVLAIVPPFWTYSALTSSPALPFLLVVAISLAAHAVVLALAASRVARRLT
jgi:fluoroquinolone transport system permease protein